MPLLIPLIVYPFGTLTKNGQQQSQPQPAQPRPRHHHDSAAAALLIRETAPDPFSIEAESSLPRLAQKIEEFTSNDADVEGDESVMEAQLLKDLALIEREIRAGQLLLVKGGRALANRIRSTRMQ